MTGLEQLRKAQEALGSGRAAIVAWRGTIFAKY